MRSIPNHLGFPSAWMRFDLCVHVRSLILSGVVITAPIILRSKYRKFMLWTMSRQCTSFFPCFLIQNDTWFYSHLIKIPAIGVDVVVDPRTPVTKRRRVFRLSFDPAYDHICKHCSHNMPVFMLWEKTILMKHLIKRWVHISFSTTSSYFCDNQLQGTVSLNLQNMLTGKQHRWSHFLRHRCRPRYLRLYFSLLLNSIQTLSNLWTCAG